VGLYTLLWYVWHTVNAGQDPAPSLFDSRSDARHYACERLPVNVAAERHRGTIPPVDPRGDWIERDVLVCSEYLLDPDLRRPEDQALLLDLDQTADGLAHLATTMRPELDGSTWLVESHTVNPEVAAKLSFATKNALMEQGLLVSDRSPILGFGDVDVITRMEPFAAFPAACRRYRDNGSLRPGDALLTAAVLDPRETQVHAGVCADGVWTWLQ